MHFKKWLIEAGEMGTSTLISGGGGGSGGFDGFGQEYRLPSRKRRKTPPLGNIGSPIIRDPRLPRNNLELSHL